MHDMPLFNGSDIVVRSYSLPHVSSLQQVKHQPETQRKSEVCVLLYQLCNQSVDQAYAAAPKASHAVCSKCTVKRIQQKISACKVIERSSPQHAVQQVQRGLL
jgi:hypothetical protein